MVKVKNGVIVLQEQATEQEVSVVMLVQGVHGDCKLADVYTLVQIGQWLQLKDSILYVE